MEKLSQVAPLPPLYRRLGTGRFFSPRRLVLLLPATSAVFLLVLYWNYSLVEHKASHPLLQSLKVLPHRVHDRSTLGVANKIYVISLPTRTDRRTDMERLRTILTLRWLYVDGISAQTELVKSILDWVRAIRAGPPKLKGEAVVGDDLDPSVRSQIEFSWPKEIDQLVLSGEPLDFWSTEIWSSPSKFSESAPYHAIPCATNNYVFPEYAVVIPEYLILTPSRVACWHSHMSVIHSIANSPSSDSNGVAIVLEDDIDMERDTYGQLKKLWENLPTDWDIVFLGHCWSNETQYRPISAFLPIGIGPPSSNSRLHPSYKPKCTHAYALSRTGARRLLLHLRYPPFAYSRAIDQAISWLVESGRLKSFSVVPSLVVQRKVGSSDVVSGTGSKWKDHLVNGVFDSL